MFWFFYLFFEYAAFEIVISTNSHARHIKLPERSTVLMVHDSINNKYGSCLKYLKYGAFTVCREARMDHIEAEKEVQWIVCLIISLQLARFLLQRPAISPPPVTPRFYTHNLH
jgi:hypothetical protein